MTGITVHCVGGRLVQVVQYQLRGVSIDISLKSFDSQYLFVHIINIKPFSLFMVVGWYHGLKMSPGL